MREVLDVSSSISSRSTKSNAARNPLCFFLNVAGIFPLGVINLFVRVISFISSRVTSGKIKPTGLTSLTLTSLAIDFFSKASNVGLERGEMIDKIIKQQSDMFIDRQVDLAPEKQKSIMKQRIKQEAIIKTDRVHLDNLDAPNLDAPNLDALNLDASPPALKQGSEIKRLPRGEPTARSSTANTIGSTAEKVKDRKTVERKVATEIEASKIAEDVINRAIERPAQPENTNKGG